MSRLTALIALSLIAVLALSWGWVLNTALAGETGPDTAGGNRALTVQAQSDAPHIFTGNVNMIGHPGNGVYGWAGITVTVWQGNRKLGEATTNSAGYFYIELPPSYDRLSFQEEGRFQVNGLRVKVERTTVRDERTTHFHLWGFAPNLLEHRVVTTPGTVLANERVTLSGNWFKAGTTISSISIRGEDIPADRINDGGSVPVDDSGHWSATVDLPLNSATIAKGRVAIRATDSEGFYGIGRVTIRSRELTIDPPAGGVGTTATVRGTGFPSKNDEGSSFDVAITYTSSYTLSNVSILPDASGNFAVEITIPGSANIPSTNTVDAWIYIHAPITEIPEDKAADHRDAQVITYNVPRRGATTTHSVPPQPSVVLSPTSGPPGTVVDIIVEGVEAWSPARVLLGDIDVTPDPTPASGGEGIANFPFLVPNLSPGDFPVEVQVAGSSASTTFTVTAAATPTPAPTAVATASVVLSPTSGPPGTFVDITMEGVEHYQPARVSLGDFDVTPDATPFSGGDGTLYFYFPIPNLSPGNFPVEVWVGGANARTTFTVTAAAAATPTPTPPPAAPQLVIASSEPPHLFIGRATLNGSAVGPGVAIDAYDGGKLIGATVTQDGGRFTIHVHRAAGVITFRVNNQAAAESWASWQSGQANHSFNLTAGGNRVEDNPSRLFAALPDLVRAFVFDNGTKQWNFFDPVAPEVSTLTRFMPQHSYWLLVSRTTRLMLNGVERQLTCVAGNCWNLIVW